MTFTLKKDINMDSLVLQHNILLEATMLLQGREGVLETEKRIYLMMAIVDALIEEDLLAMCNEDERGLTSLVIEEVEPFYNTLVTIPNFDKSVEYMTQVLLNRCQEIWDNQHSLMGVVDTILTVIATMDPEDKKQVLKETAKIAEKAHEKRTEAMKEKVDTTNSKLEQLVELYRKNPQPTNDAK